MVLTEGSPLGIIVCHREIKAAGSAGVVDAGLWDPGCSTAEAPWSHGAGKEGLEEAAEVGGVG